ncbi:MAG: hypothetical protein U1F00_19785 [Rhodoferax sp.]
MVPLTEFQPADAEHAGIAHVQVVPVLSNTPVTLTVPPVRVMASRRSWPLERLPRG